MDHETLETIRVSNRRDILERVGKALLLVAAECAGGDIFGDITKIDPKDGILEADFILRGDVRNIRFRLEESARSRLGIERDRLFY